MFWGFFVCVVVVLIFFLFFFCMLPDFLGVESFRVSLTGHC